MTNKEPPFWSNIVFTHKGKIIDKFRSKKLESMYETACLLYEEKKLSPTTLYLIIRECYDEYRDKCSRYNVSLIPVSVREQFVTEMLNTINEEGDLYL